MWPNTVMSCVDNFDIVLSVRSGNESRYPAVIALRNVDIGGNPSDPCMKTILSIEVNCCGFAFMS